MIKVCNKNCNFFKFFSIIPIDITNIFSIVSNFIENYFRNNIILEIKDVFTFQEFIILNFY